MKWHFDLPLWRWRPAAHLHPAALWHLRTRGEKTPTQSDGRGLKRACLIVMMNYFCAATGKKCSSRGVWNLAGRIIPVWRVCIIDGALLASSYGCLFFQCLLCEAAVGTVWWRAARITLCSGFTTGQEARSVVFCRLLVSVTTSLELMWNKMYNIINLYTCGLKY